MSKQYPIVAVITPTTGACFLKQNLESVSKQTYKHIKHYVVIDGPQFKEQAKQQLEPFDDKLVIELPENTGSGGYNGHRIYGALPYIINADYVVFLDEDNWIDENHIEMLVDKSQYYDWVFSLRKIVDKDSNYICNDDCESLGLWPTVLSETEYFVDVGCYFLPKTFAIQFSSIWYRRARHPQEQPEVDRLLMQVLLQKKYTYGTSGVYSLNYRVGNRSDSVQSGFFLQGNEIMKQRYGESFPWRKSEDYYTIKV